jgi:hypothetical protein
VDRDDANFATDSTDATPTDAEPTDPRLRTIPPGGRKVVRSLSCARPFAP